MQNRKSKTISVKNDDWKLLKTECINRGVKVHVVFDEVFDAWKKTKNLN